MVPISFGSYSMSAYSPLSYRWYSVSHIFAYPALNDLYNNRS